MRFDKRQITKSVIVLIFFICMLYANFYAVRRMSHYGIELYFYSKLSVAYDIAGQAGFEEELDKIISSGEMPREAALARSFKDKLKNIKNPYGFISERATYCRNKLHFIRSLRTIAIVLMFAIFILRISLNVYDRRKSKRGS